MAARRRTKVNMEFAKNVAAWAAENWQALVGYGASVVILADYMVPEYRDFKAGRFLYRVCRMRFKEAGVREFVAEGAGRQQVKYYLKNGFRRVEAEGGGERYVLEL